MDFYSLIFLSCALGMDAFAVSLCKGFSVKKLHLKHYPYCWNLFWWISSFDANYWLFYRHNFCIFYCEY